MVKMSTRQLASDLNGWHRIHMTPDRKGFKLEHAAKRDKGMVQNGNYLGVSSYSPRADEETCMLGVKKI